MTDLIRPARVSDVDALVALENGTFQTDRISRRSFGRLLASRSATILVAAKGRELVGYAVVLTRRGSGVARLYSLAVAPTHLGTGAGRALLKAAEDAARSAGRRVVHLEVREDNARAIGLYDTSGYRAIGRRAAYYEDGATALRLEKPLHGPQP